MSYDITIQARTRGLGDKMIWFLRKNAKSWDFLTGETKEDEGLKSPGRAEPRWARGGLPYCKRPGHVGFNYGGDGSDMYYKYVLIRWMATKIGVRDPKTKLPRFLYDDIEWEVINPKKYDGLGIRTSHGLSFLQRACEHPFIRSKAFRAEMKRLDDLWEQQG